MTACVNRKHTKKVAAVVTASLVGALSLGVAPVAAMATDGIDLMALDTAFADGALTRAQDSDGRGVAIPSTGTVTVDEGTFLVPTEITPDGGADPVTIHSAYDGHTAHTANATITYFKGFNNTSNAVTPAGPTLAGTDFPVGNYTAVVTMTDGGVYNGQSFSVNFIVAEAADLTDATLFDNIDEIDNIEDTTFTYNGENQKVGVVLDGKVLKETTDYTISFDWQKNGKGEAPSGTTTGLTDIKNAGTYKATITGAGKYLGQKKVVTFTVDRLDVSKADLSIADVSKSDFISNGMTIKKVVADGVQLDTDVNTAVNIDVVSYVTDASDSPTTGKATASVYAEDGTNITGETPQTVEFNIVDTALDETHFFYGDTAYNAKDVIDVNLAEGGKFDAGKISVKTAASSTADSLDAGWISISYADAEGNEVDASELQNPGVYKVTARVNAGACNYAYGSPSVTWTVNVKSGNIDPDTDIIFNFDGKVGTKFEKTYDGVDFLDQLAITINTESGKLVEGEDYTVKAYDDRGDEVDSVVDVLDAGAGSYKIVLDIPGYNDEIDENDRTCEVTVKQLKLTDLYVGGDALTKYVYDTNKDKVNDATVWYLGYTGEELEPALEFGYYTGTDGKPAKYSVATDADLTWHALPTDSIEITGYKYDKSSKDGSFNAATATDADAMKNKGGYKVRFIFDDGNYDYTGNETDNIITVTDANVAFADVDASKWYASSVFQAKQLGYVSGVSGTNLFAPENSITRADALVIISRMAGADVSFGDDWMSQNINWLTRYSDVDAGAYYAKAVAWGTKVGIVHGDSGADTFRPQDPVTREEFAAMLSNYAKAMGEDISADADAVLAEFPDGSAVSEWAEGAVAWAAASEVMGNGGVLNPAGQITRAEVAAMAVNYQPEGVSADVIG